jgi:putative ABC transport system ATP-binding protein
MVTVVLSTAVDVVRLADVSRVYGRGEAEVHALRGVSLGVPKGSFTAVMGPSGSGKTTLLQCAAGLDRPTGGRIVVGGNDITGMSEVDLTKLRRDRIGFVFQDFNLVSSLSAQHNVELPLRLAGRRPSRAEVHDVLDRVGLGGRAKHKPSELSGGQQQRVAIARALVLARLKELTEQGGQTVVMVTHDPVAASYADRVVFLVDGLVHAELRDPKVQEISDLLSGLEG